MTHTPTTSKARSTDTISVPDASDSGASSTSGSSGLTSAALVGIGIGRYIVLVVLVVLIVRSFRKCGGSTASDANAVAPATLHVMPVSMGGFGFQSSLSD